MTRSKNARIARLRGAARLAVGPLAVASLALALGCNDSNSVGGDDLNGATITCETSQSTIGAGSAQGVLVSARVTRDGLAVTGGTVVFTSNIGDVNPDSVTTGSDGRATAVFSPPGTSGTAIITTAFNDTVAGTITSTCGVTVTGASSPRLSVSVIAPPSLAGLTINVRFNQVFLSLAPGGAVGVGPLSSAAAGCFTQSADLGGGMVRLVEACPNNIAVGGSEVARFTFNNSGPTQTVGDFAVTCEGVDVVGNVLPTTCTTALTQI
jgi:hypothetical protein